MINNATNDSLVNWIVLWTLTHPVLLVKAMRLLVQLWNGHWVKDLCPTLTAFSVTQTDVGKSWKHIIAQKSLYPNSNLVVAKLQLKLQRLKIRSWFSSMDQRIWHLSMWSPVSKLSEKVHNRPRNNSGTVCVGKKLEKQNLNFMHRGIWTIMPPGRWDTCQKEVNHEDDISTGKNTQIQITLILTQSTCQRNWSWMYKKYPSFLSFVSLCAQYYLQQYLLAKSIGLWHVENSFQLT